MKALLAALTLLLASAPAVAGEAPVEAGEAPVPAGEAPVLAGETVMTRSLLPGGERAQEVYFSTSEADYLEKRDAILARLMAGDPGAADEAGDVPYMRLATTAPIGVAVDQDETAGRQHGRTLRRITAAEDALFLYQRWKHEVSSQ